MSGYDGLEVYGNGWWWWILLGAVAIFNLDIDDSSA